MLGKEWAVFLKDERGVKIYNREKINQHATNFYKNLYNDQSGIGEPSTSNLEEEPPFFMDEIQAVVKHLKSNKTAGSDKIYN